MSGEVTNNQGQPTASGSSSATPTSSPSGAEAGGNTDAFDFAGLATYDDSGSDAGTPPVAPAPSEGTGAVAPAPAAATPPAVPASAPTAAPVVPPVAPAAAPVPSPQGQQPGAQPPVVAPSASAQPPASPAAAPAAPAQQVNFEQHRAEFLPQLRKMYAEGPVFKDEQMVEKLRTNPEEVLPDLAAQLHYEVTIGAYNSVMGVLPEMIRIISGEVGAAKDAESQFYSAWPVLNDAKYASVVTNSIRAYRAANPNTDLKTAIQAAGMLAMISAGLPLDQAMAVASTPAAPAAPAAPAMMPGPARPPGVNSSPALPPAGVGNAPDNPFAELYDLHRAGEI